MQQNNFQNLDGSLLAARYAYMPNRLRYCGGSNFKEIVAYINANTSDDGLKNLLEEFATMYPYLKLIARANKIIDPFNYKVVEAYWIGNELLKNVSMNNYYQSLVDDHLLKKKFKPKLLEKVFGQIPVGAKPHHNFHVFSIPKRTGHYPVPHTIETMDSCRVTVAKLKAKKLEPEAKEGLVSAVTVEYQPLKLAGNKIILGASIEKEIWMENSDKVYSKKLAVGDWVAIHWDWLCDILTQNQAMNLKKWTEFNLQFINL